MLPNGSLFASGDTSIGARIKKKLMKECNLHTIVRLPQGVFAPYTQIPSNLLFFEKGRETKEVWFYEVQLPEGQRGYAKTKPMRFEEFEPCVEWWGGEKREGRVEGGNAWKVPKAEIEKAGFNLDISNPNASGALAYRSPSEVLNDLIKAEHKILDLLEDLRKDLDEVA